jgi:peptidyl-prolyl cis-trans isomerase A (cyclophilin A)
LKGAAPYLLLAAAALAGACGSDSGCPAVAAPEPTAAQRVLLDPSSDALDATPPDTFHILLTTSVGAVDIEVMSAWAPLGAARLYNLARNGFFDGNRFFRVLPGFIAQFGVSGVPAIQAAWNAVPLPDEPAWLSNLRGTLVYAMAGPGSRTTQLFINYLDNPQLDALGFAPVGRVVSGMSNLIRLYGGYGETQPGGSGPAYGCMLEGGEPYLARGYPRLDRILTAEVRE